jgi:hypothetical protein
MPLMEAALRCEYLGQEIINRWNFLATGTPATVSLSFALASAMGLLYDEVIPHYPNPGYYATISALQTNAMLWREIVTKDVYSVTDFYTAPFIHGEAGSAAGTSSSPIMAYGFRTNRVVANIARGTKRFGGVPESALGEGGVIESAALTAMVSVADLMGEVLTYDDEGNTLSFAPCIVSKEQYTTPSGKKAYRYYSTFAAQSAHIASGIAWEPYTQVRGQASRQYGKGA